MRDRKYIASPSVEVRLIRGENRIIPSSAVYYYYYFCYDYLFTVFHATRMEVSVKTHASYAAKASFKESAWPLRHPEASRRKTASLSTRWLADTSRLVKVDVSTCMGLV